MTKYGSVVVTPSQPIFMALTKALSDCSVLKIPSTRSKTSSKILTMLRLFVYSGVKKVLCHK